MGWERAVRRVSFFTRCKGGMKNCCSVPLFLHDPCQFHSNEGLYGQKNKDATLGRL